MNAHLQSLTDAELAQRIIDTLDDRDAAALASACLMAHAHGKDRPDVKTARTCCTLAGANAQRVMPFLGYLPLKGYADGWADAEQGAHGPGIVDRTQEPGLFVSIASLLIEPRRHRAASCGANFRRSNPGRLDPLIGRDFRELFAGLESVADVA